MTYPHGTSRDQQLNILLVEDEPFVREATRGILQRAGFQLAVADSATA